MLVSEFITNVQSYMDAEGSNRWSPALIQQVGGMISNNEWSDIINQNQYYRFAQVPVTCDSEGRIAIADLTTGSGDTTQYFYRVLSGPTDGNFIWQETDFAAVPLGTQQGAQFPNQYQYYLAGDYFQLLPPQAGLQLTVPVNHVPPTIAQLAGPTSVIPFVPNYEFLLVWMTAATLLMKGGSESQAASDLMTLSDGARKNMLGDVGRRTTRPTFAIYTDPASAWNGGGMGFG